MFTIILWCFHLHNPKTSILEGLKAIDWAGTVTLIGGTLCVLLGLDFGGVSYAWSSPTVFCLVILGVLTLCMFVAVQWRYARYPLMPLRLFGTRRGAASLVAAACQAACYIAGAYYLPLYFQGALGCTPLLAGVYVLPYAISLAVSAALAGWLFTLTGRCYPYIQLGFAVTVLGFGLFIDLDSRVSWPKIITFQLLAGIGLGPNFEGLLVILQNSINARDIATATSTNAFFRLLSEGVSIVVGGVIFQNTMQQKEPDLERLLGMTTANLLAGNSAAANIPLIQHLAKEQAEVVRGAFRDALCNMWIAYTTIAVLGLFMTLIIRDEKLSEQVEVILPGLEAEEERWKIEHERRKLKAGCT